MGETKVEYKMKKYNEPQIYIVNNEKIAERLKQKYNIAVGNLGIVKAVEYDPYKNNRYVNLEYSMIDNLHEYSVVIIDLQNKNEVKYCTEDDKPNGIPFLFEMSYPQRNFIPAPLVLKMMRSELKEQCLKIIFAGEKYKQKYGWVEVTGQDLLTETGGKLVEAVCTYFKWLGFTDVISIDGSEEILREDIQITEDNKLYIIEVKGIGGTSTDAECAQVAKHRRRRERENRDKEIIPIYIVNHQRYMNPLLRQNPPFSDNQIEYAESDERGLLTTWQLYNQNKLIEAGIFTKEETRDSLDEWGLISLIPKRLKRVGIFEEYFKKPKAGILKLNNSEIKVGDEIYGQKGGKWIRTKITSLQLDDKNVDSVQNGEAGIATETELEKGVEIFINKS